MQMKEMNQYIHAEKADMECKFWLDLNEFEIREAFSNNMTNCDLSEAEIMSNAEYNYLNKVIFPF